MQIIIELFKIYLKFCLPILAKGKKEASKQHKCKKQNNGTQSMHSQLLTAEPHEKQYYPLIKYFNN